MEMDSYWYCGDVHLGICNGQPLMVSGGQWVVSNQERCDGVLPEVLMKCVVVEDGTILLDMKSCCW